MMTFFAKGEGPHEHQLDRTGKILRQAVQEISKGVSEERQAAAANQGAVQESHVDHGKRKREEALENARQSLQGQPVKRVRQVKLGAV